MPVVGRDRWLQVNRTIDKRSVLNPLRRFTVIFILLVALATIENVASDSDILKHVPDKKYIDWGLSVLWFLVGILLIRHLSRAVTHISAKREKYDARVTMLINRTLTAVGYIFVLVVGLHLLHVKVGSILVGGAVTGVIVGIGAQSTLSNFFAGLILFTIRPFSVGQTIITRTYLFSGMEYSGVVVDINWFHTVLRDGSQKRVIPNSSMVVSAITIVAQWDIQVHTVPLPYRVPLKSFEQALKAATDGRAEVTAREFGESTYSVEVKIPSDADPDLIRAAVYRLQAED